MCDFQTLKDIEKSDYMLCNNSAFLHYKDKKTNDGMFVQQMSKTRPMCIRDIDAENAMFITPSSRNAVCNPFLSDRGGNVGCEPNRQCPKLYTQYNMNEFLLVPCPKNTYKNYLVFDNKKTCSKSHQILNNWTKRKDFSSEQDVANLIQSGLL